MFTGALLPWDQLALESIDAGLDLAGILRALGSDVRFIFIDGAEVSKSSYVIAVIAHLLLGTTALLTAIVTGILRIRGGLASAEGDLA